MCFIANNKDNYIFQPALVLYLTQWMLLIIGFVVMAFVTQLSIFHLWLRYHSLTTFELITLQRRYEQEQEKILNDEEQGK